MLSLIVVAIMLGFPTAFTLMGMGMIFAFLSYYSRPATHRPSIKNTLDLMVQRAYSVMSNDVLISIPLFVFIGYLVERSNLIEKLFRSLHVALARIPRVPRGGHPRHVRRVRDGHRASWARS
jgi:TRAP-type mannitol/chloroaromatic compound transport system permease large subunit